MIARMIARPPSATSRASAGSIWVGPLVQAAAVAAAMEFLLLRVLARTAIHIPGLEQLATPYRIVAVLGRYAFFASSVLLVFALVALAALGVRGAEARARATGALVGAALLTLALARLGALPDRELALLVAAAVASLAWLAAKRLGSVRWLPIVLYGASFAAGAAASVSASSNASKTAAFLLAGELLAVAAASAAPLLLMRRPGRRAIASGFVAGFAVIGALGASAPTVKILMLWNFGLAGYFAPFVYAIAATGVVVAVVGLAQNGSRVEAVALMLLVFSGVGLHSTYQSGLAIAGLALLVLAQATVFGWRGGPAGPKVPN